MDHDDFFDFCSEMLCIADHRGHFIKLNSAWTRSLGWSTEELMSKPYVDFVHQDDIELTLKEAKLLQSPGYETVHFRNRYRCKDGSYKWLAWQAKSKGSKVLATARDFTVEQDHWDALISANTKLEQKEKLLRNLIELQEKEKELICFEFHDGLIQYVAGAAMLLESIRDTINDERVDEALRSLHSGLQDGRRVIRGIRPTVLGDLGVAAAIEDFIDQLPDDFEATLTIDPSIGRMPPHYEAAIYRIVQEGLNNARKHSGSQIANVTIKRANDMIRVEVRDKGRGFDVQDKRGSGLGLIGMDERARLLGGDFQIHSEPGRGTRLEINLPIE